MLLSELYTAQKRYRDAFELHEDIISRLSEGQSAPGLNAIEVATKHTELMKFAFKRHGKFDKEVQQYEDLFRALDKQFGNDKAWKDKRPQLDKWAPGLPRKRCLAAGGGPRSLSGRLTRMRVLGSARGGRSLSREELVGICGRGVRRLGR